MARMQIIVRAQTVSARTHSRLMRTVHVLMGTTWKTDILPQHFQPGAKNKYRYAPRRSTIHYGQAIKRGLSKAQTLTLLREARDAGKGQGNRIPYWRMKQAMGKPDNVLSGALRDGSQQAHVSSTRKRVTVRIRSPFKIREQARFEIERVTKQETTKLFRIAHDFYSKKAQDPKNMTTRALKTVES